MSRSAIIAMDGPAGAGKSSVARRLAQALGFTLLDTGALYRAVAWAADRAGVALDDAARVTHVADDLVRRGAIRIEPAEGSGMRLIVDGRALGDEIRTPEISMGASKVSAIPGVRAALLDLQRDFAEGGVARGVVAEGRDIGTVVFPDADLKIFLTASVEERARRRHVELAARGSQVSLEQTRAEVVTRDKQDEERPIAPLRRADDAVLVDSSALEVDDAVALCLRLARERLGERG
ncbi:MAG: (d)CMP kinase [Deltaproteobacteria bacterium]|nr:(d)CMP kinase [Deltaproteobacteria bacterium]